MGVGESMGEMGKNFCPNFLYRFLKTVSLIKQWAVIIGRFTPRMLVE